MVKKVIKEMITWVMAGEEGSSVTKVNNTDTVDYAEKENKTQPPSTKGAVYSADGESEYSPNPNEFLGDGADLVEKVIEMEDKDPRFGGLILTRCLAVTSLPRQIEGEGPEADFLREMFGEIKGFNQMLYELIWTGTMCGYAVPERVWGVGDAGNLSGKFVITDLKPRNPGMFRFGEKNELIMMTKDDSEGKAVDELYFPVLTFHGKFGNRYGKPLAQKVYTYWNLKLHSLKFWAIFTERFACPITVVTNEGGLDEDKEAEIINFIQNVRTRTGLLVPKGVVVELLQARQEGSVSSYESFLAYLDSGIAIAILGQTLTSDNQKTGSYALGNVHNLVRKDIREADIAWIETWMNDVVIPPALELNFKKPYNVPKWRIISKDAVDMKAMSEVVKILVEAGFKRIPVRWLHEVFGIPEPKDGEDVLELSTGTREPEGKGTENLSEGDAAVRMSEILLYIQEQRKLA